MVLRTVALRNHVQRKDVKEPSTIELSHGFKLVKFRNNATKEKKNLRIWEFVNQDGDLVGELNLYLDYEGYAGIDRISLNKSARGLGLGRQAVLKLKELYGKISSDPQGSTSDDAVKMWQSVGAKQVPANNGKKYKWAVEDIVNLILDGKRFSYIIESAYVRDLSVDDLDKETKTDVLRFIPDGGTVVEYGMVADELLPKADQLNLETAREHVSDTDAEECADEVHSKLKDKCILMVNDKIVDGHHFLAKAERGGLTNSLRVLDLTPARVNA